MLYDLRPIIASKQIKLPKPPQPNKKNLKNRKKKTKNFSESYLLMCKVTNMSQSFIKLANVYCNLFFFFVHCNLNFYNLIVFTINDHLQMNTSVLRIYFFQEIHFLEMS